MQADLVVAITGAIVLPVISFLWGQNKNIKSDYKEKQDKQDKIIDDLLTAKTQINESLARVHMRIDRVEVDHQKLETGVELKMDKFSEKLEKIYDLLIDEKMNGMRNNNEFHK